MAETIDSVEILLTANIAPMLAQVQQGLANVRASVQNLKGVARVDLTASIDQLMGNLRDAAGKVTAWKAQADRSSVVTPKIDPAPVLSGLNALKAKLESAAASLGGIFFALEIYQRLENAIRTVIRASDDQELALARLQTAVTNSAAATEGMFERLTAQAEELAAQYGFMGDEAIESAQAVLVGFGLTEGAIKQLTPVLLDMAAGLEKTSGQEQDLETLAKLVGKAMNGQGEALGRMGVQIDAALAKTDALGAVMAGTAKFTGQAAAMAATGAGQVRGLTNSGGELQEMLGGLIKSVLSPLVVVLKAVLDAFLWLPQPVQVLVVALGILKVALLATNTTIAVNIGNLILWSQTMGTTAVAAIARFVAAATATNVWAAMTAGIGTTIVSLRALTATAATAAAALGTIVTLGAAIGVIVGASLAWAANQCFKLDAAIRQLDDAEREQIRDHMLFRYGIVMSNKEMDLWVQLSPKVRNALALEAKATGATRIEIEKMTAARDADRQAQQDALVIASDKEGEAARAEGYRLAGLSRIQQLKEEIDTQSKLRVDSSKTEQERSDAAKKYLELQRQLGTEERRVSEDASKRGIDAAKRAKDAWVAMVQEANEAYRSMAEKTKAALDSLASEMAAATLKAIDPQAADVAAAQIKAAKELEILDKLDKDNKYAETRKQIEEELGRAIAEIHLRYATQEAQREKEKEDRDKAAADAKLREAESRMNGIISGIMDPIKGVVQGFLAEGNVAAAAFSKMMYDALQPVSNAITQFLTGAKVNWASVLRQMAGQFISILVNQVISGIVKMVAAQLFGEKTKAAAATAGTAVAVGANATQQASNSATAGTGIMAAIANIFKAHSSIPWVGVAIAIGFVAIMMALFSSMKSKTKAMATGGLVDHPQMALIGEAGPEYVAPAQDFKSVVAGLVASTLDTVRVAAQAVVPVNTRFAGSPAMAYAGAGAGMGSEVHLHGFALVDSGEREMVARTNRLLDRARREARSLTMTDEDHVGS
jgi:lambda family phage tail tape measure protein